MKQFVGYYRVSTEDQGKSGLGLSAQKDAIRAFCTGVQGKLLGEFQDVESGTKVSRSGFDQAVSLASRTGATLVVKELSRISRNGLSAVHQLDQAGVSYIECGSPSDPEMVKGIKFVLAKDERDKTAGRTREALQQIKEKLSRGEVHISKAGNEVTRLGNPENLSDLSRQRSLEVRREKAVSHPNNRMATGMIVQLVEKGDSFRSIARTLNQHGFKTSKGNNFSDVQAKRLYERFLQRADKQQVAC